LSREHSHKILLTLEIERIKNLWLAAGGFITNVQDTTKLCSWNSLERVWISIRDHWSVWMFKTCILSNWCITLCSPFLRLVFIHLYVCHLQLPQESLHSLHYLGFILVSVNLPFSVPRISHSPIFFLPTPSVS
jgi:hypothetical protein